MSSNDLDTTRSRIIEAAGQVFADRGFEAATVRDICHAAGANIAAVNYYFGDKQRLYIQAVLAAHRSRMEQAVLPNWFEGTPPETKLTDFIATFIRRVRTGPKDAWQNRLMMREMMRPDAACAEVVRESIRPQFEVLLQILRSMLPAATSDGDLHLTAFSVVGQCLFYHFADPVVQHLVDGAEYADYSIDKLARHIARFSLAAIQRDSSTRPTGALR
jgi:TetR/AcrR family transcriptional regulator, regulator of cefoperazone and chloramphenicol sensitivity